MARSATWQSLLAEIASELRSAPITSQKEVLWSASGRSEPSPLLSEVHRLRKLRIRLAKYGLTPAEYDAMRIAANYCCQVCKKHESELPNGLVVDHHRDDGFPRGLLCIGCNSALGIFKADINMLLAAVEYLKAAE